MRYQLYIFDLDGTLVDTSPGIMDSVRFVERTLGLAPVSRERLATFIGPPLEDSFARCYDPDPARVRQMVEVYRRRYREDGVGNGTIYPGIPDILDDIRAAGALSAVATLKHHTMAGLSLERFGLASRFDAIAARDDAHPSKADLIRRAMELLGQPDPTSVLMIGDSRYDGVGAAEAGVDFAALTYGFGFSEPGSLEGLPTVFTAHQPEELVGFIRECLETRAVPV